MKIISKHFYEEVKYGCSLFSDSKIAIIGEQTAELEDGRIVEQYLYNILGYAAQNGKPFLSVKSNIILE